MTTHPIPEPLVHCPQCYSARQVPPSAYDVRNGLWICLDCGERWADR
jgi:ribosomal protein L37AE/L43A